MNSSMRLQQEADKKGKDVVRPTRYLAAFVVAAAGAACQAEYPDVPVAAFAVAAWLLIDHMLVMQGEIISLRWQASFAREQIGWLQERISDDA